MNNRTVICKIMTGSHLYGTDTPESDVDYKGIFIPSYNEILLGKIPKLYSESTGDSKTRNTKDDIDCEFHSIHHFMKMAQKGDTLVFDMLWAPMECIVEYGPMYSLLRSIRHLFLTRDLSAFVGYGYSQAKKYSIKGKRIDELDSVINFLTELKPSDKLSVYEANLPEGEFLKFVTQKGEEFYEVLGRKLQINLTIKYALDTLQKIRAGYGSRAELAKNNNAMDWKAISHAVRAADEAIELYLTGNIQFPLQNAEYIRNVKLGKFDYVTNVQPGLEEKMRWIEELREESKLPRKADMDRVNRMIAEGLASFFHSKGFI